MKRILRLSTSFILLFLVLTNSQVAQSKLYKCVGENNEISYSQVRCPNPRSQKVIKTQSRSDGSSAAFGIYKRIEDVISSFKCDTPEAGLRKFPSRADLVAIARNSASRGYKEMYQKERAIRDEIKLARRYKLPAGKACEYSFGGKFVTISFNGERSEGGFVEFDPMYQAAQKLGYPVVPLERKRNTTTTLGKRAFMIVAWILKIIPASHQQ